MDVERNWLKTASELKENSDCKLVYILGECDTGKTTFSCFLLRTLVAEYAVGYLDCDPGQSLIGPPATLGLKLYSKKRDNPKRDNPERVFLYFVGSTSPACHIGHNIRGIKRLKEKALDKQAQKLIIDSSGFVMGKLACEFQFQLIDLLKPDYVIAFSRDYLVNRFLENFMKNPKIKLLKLSVSPSVVQRTAGERKSYREKRFRRYFQKAASREIILDNTGLQQIIRDIYNKKVWRSLLIALRDKDEFVIALGILEDINPENKSLRIYSPGFDPKRLASIQFGAIYLEESGKQLPGYKP